MAENEKTDIKELKTEEQSSHQSPDGILTKDKWKDLCNKDIF